MIDNWQSYFIPFAVLSVAVCIALAVGRLTHP
jgi:hypothetical protein